MTQQKSPCGVGAPDTGKDNRRCTRDGASQAPGQAPDSDLALFLAVLFNDGDLIEIRPIEIWRDDGKKQSDLIGDERQWLTPREVLEKAEDLRSITIVTAQAAGIPLAGTQTVPETPVAAE